jgi:nucleotide-binding universal stress UspA family protein
MQMDAYKHILVAVDGSDTSNRAVEEAIRLAAEMQAELRIVHAVDEAALNWDAGYVNFGEIQEAYRKSSEAILDRSATAAREAGLKADTKLLESDSVSRRVSEMIAQEATAWPADLIVVGTHGRRGFSHLLLGSVAEGVVRVATKPVLLVRGK